VYGLRRRDLNRFQTGVAFVNIEYGAIPNSRCTYARKEARRRVSFGS